MRLILLLLLKLKLSLRTCQFMEAGDSPPSVRILVGVYSALLDGYSSSVPFLSVPGGHQSPRTVQVIEAVWQLPGWLLTIHFLVYLPLMQTVIDNT